MKMKNKYLNICIILCLIILMHIFKSKLNLNLTNDIKHFATVFTTIMIDAVPFVILGSFVSALIQLYVSQDVIKKIIPKNIILSYIVTALMGLVMPICECAIVPIGRRLMKKGLPKGLGVTFMFAVPIVNPIVILSTHYAFYENYTAVILRTVGGFAASIIIGITIDFLCKNDDILKNEYDDDEIMCTCGCITNNEKNSIKSVIKHTNREFLEITRYLIYGAFLSSVFSVMCSHYNIVDKLRNNVAIILLMMFLGFALSLCSEADAFVAKSFLNTAGMSSVLGFLLLGPMLDLKNLIILYGVFKKKFVIKLTVVTTVVVFAFCMLFMSAGF